MNIIVSLCIIMLALKVGTPIGNYWLPVVIGGGGEQSPRRWWNCSGLDCRSEGIPRYTSVPLLVFVPKGTVVAICDRFDKMLRFLLIIRARSFAGWPGGQFWHGGTGQGLVSFPQKNQKFKKSQNIYKNTLWFHHFLFYIKSNPWTELRQGIPRILRKVTSK